MGRLFPDPDRLKKESEESMIIKIPLKTEQAITKEGNGFSKIALSGNEKIQHQMTTGFCPAVAS
jgi:hypothetical protein